VVAIGHERDVSLSELAADLRASTPSNAAEILVPSKEEVINFYSTKIINSKSTVIKVYETYIKDLDFCKNSLEQAVAKMFNINKILLDAYSRTLKANDPDAVLKKGYALIKNSKGQWVSSGVNLKKDEIISIKFSDTEREARVLG
jgi:exodeoxyribonuclease VII large subunit